jgi:hypothetical protein
MNRQTKLTILIFCILKLAIHLIADSHSGFQGDELLHIATGKHLAFGYMEFPPLIGIFAFIQNLFQSQSIFVHHIFSHLASIIILIFVSKTTVELGGKNKAVFIILLGLIIAPGFGRSQQLFQPVVFSQLFWVLSFYSLVRFVKYLDKKSLWLLTVFSILGFLSKYDAVIFITGLAALFIFKRTRDALIQNKFWWNILVAFIFIMSNLIWQITNDYPVLQMISRLYETQLDKINRISTLKQLLIEINPIVSLLLFIPGLFYMLTDKNKTLNIPLAFSIFISISLLIYTNGKAYYFYPLVLTIIPFGALLLEKLIQQKKWTFYPIIFFMGLGGILIPFGMPVFSLNNYIKYIYPSEKMEIEGGKYGIRFAEYYSQKKWDKTLADLKDVYDSLPQNEKTNTVIWGKHYSQAGIIELMGNNYNLPDAFSLHGSFYTWAPNKGEMPKTLIAFSESKSEDKIFFEPYFETVTAVKTIYNPYAKEEDELYQTIFICKNPKQNYKELKLLFKDRIFE